MTRVRPLPRSLDPLPGEALTGYLLRLAHRLDLSPTRVAVLTGLADPRQPTIPSGQLLALPPDRAAVFARATRLSTAEVTALTLISLADRYPPVNPGFSGRHRQHHGIFVKENWVFSRASRYCPDCLAGDGNPIQDQHGGAWELVWRLPVVFACPHHQRLLRHTCPGCQQPAHHRATGQTHLLNLPAHPDLHPVQCRNSITSANDQSRWRACQNRLDEQHQGRTHSGDSELIRFQQRLLTLLHGEPSESITSIGQRTSPARYFVDLRVLSCLATSSWPAAHNLLAHNTHAAQAIDEHVRHTRAQVDTIRRSGRTAREIAFYDRPPLDSATGAHLLTLAHQITSTADTDTARTLLRPLVTNAPPGMRLWIRQFLAGTGHCSPGLHAALGLEIGSRHVMKTLGVRPATRSPRPQPQPTRFGIQHIPQHLLPEWHAEYLAEITDAKPHLVRRAAAARLAQICVGGPATAAAELLGIPRYATENALTVVQQNLRDRARDTFETAIHSMSKHLDTATARIDYGKRRDALKAWAISPDEWDTLIADLPTQPVSGAVRSHIDWGDSKRLLASVWICVRVTHGEHIFAPAIRPNPNQPRPGGPVIRHIHTRWPLISAHQPTGHYIALRQRLVTFADTLAATISDGET